MTSLSNPSGDSVKVYFYTLRADVNQGYLKT